MDRGEHSAVGSAGWLRLAGDLCKCNYPFALGLITESAKDIPQENLTYLGNLPGEDLSLPPDELHTESYVDTTVGWDGSKYNRWFEKRVLDKYLSWLGK